MLFDLPPLTIAIVNVVAWPIIQLGVAWLGTRVDDAWFNPWGALHRTRWWEFDGRLYEKAFLIRLWKDRLPDGARLFKQGFPKKRLAGRDSAYMRRFLHETCRSEEVHLVVLLSSFLFFLWNPVWAGWLMVAYGLLSNLPCILAQRYNRLRLKKLPGCGHAPHP